jgi:uncharacterized damage-inducible protein DinB
MMEGHMIKPAMIAAVFAAASAMQGQTSISIISEVRDAYDLRKGDLTKAADKMSAEDYGFRPAPELRTFGETLAHVADVQMGLCAAAKGERKSVNAASKTTKADLVAALKASFDECDGAFDSMTETTAKQVIKTGAVERTRLGTLLYATTHDTEEYGYLAMYLRLKSITPPSTERR